jgi:hypothetical protein
MAGAQNYLEFLKGASERRTTRTGAIVEQLLANETDPNSINWDETLKGSNLNKDEIMTLYKQAKAEQEARQAEAQSKADMEERKMSLEEYKADVQKQYNEGRLSLQERDMILSDARGWYNAETGRMNAGGGSESESEKASKIYDAKTLPVDIKNLVVGDLQSGEEISKNDLYESYPEVNEETLDEFYKRYYTKPKDPNNIPWVPFI